MTEKTDVTLVVNDGWVDSAPSSTTMSVANQPPVINAGADTWYRRGQWAYLWVSGYYDPDGEIVAWAWRQISGNPVTLTVTNQPWLEFSIPKNFKPGDLVFEVTATDNLGASSSDQVTVTVVH